MSVCAFNTVQPHKRGQRAAAFVFPSECWCLIFPLFLMWLHGSFLNAKQKKRSATSVSSLMNSCFVSWVLILKTGAGSTKQSKEECRVRSKKKKAAIKLNCEEKHAKSLQPLLTLHRFSSLAPLCFHLSCDVSPSAWTAKKLLWNIWLWWRKGSVDWSGGSWGCDSTWAPVSEMWPKLDNRSPRSAPSHRCDWISAVQMIHCSVNTLSVCLISYSSWMFTESWPRKQQRMTWHDLLRRTHQLHDRLMGSLI